ncbi:hypothetical protein BH24BAC1_BH24BAC1_26120 [soil metagenome]
MHQRRQQVLDGQFDSVLLRHDPLYYGSLVQQFGEPLVRQVERQVTLAVTDRHWADYLEEADQVRQNIHWVVLGGLNPFYAFQKKADILFSELLHRINEDVVATLKTVQFTANGIDLEREGLQGPTSTWTYLISDNPFGDRLEMMLAGSGNVGFAAGAALLWPLLGLYFSVKKNFGKEKEKPL